MSSNHSQSSQHSNGIPLNMSTEPPPTQQQFYQSAYGHPPQVVAYQAYHPSSAQATNQPPQAYIVTPAPQNSASAPPQQYVAVEGSTPVILVPAGPGGSNQGGQQPFSIQIPAPQVVHNDTSSQASAHSHASSQHSHHHSSMYPTSGQQQPISQFYSPVGVVAHNSSSLPVPSTTTSTASGATNPMALSASSAGPTGNCQSGIVTQQQFIRQQQQVMQQQQLALQQQQAHQHQQQQLQQQHLVAMQQANLTPPQLVVPPVTARDGPPAAPHQPQQQHAQATRGMQRALLKDGIHPALPLLLQRRAAQVAQLQQQNPQHPLPEPPRLSETFLQTSPREFSLRWSTRRLRYYTEVETLTLNFDEQFSHLVPALAGTLERVVRNHAPVHQAVMQQRVSPGTQGVPSADGRGSILRNQPYVAYETATVPESALEEYIRHISKESCASPVSFVGALVLIDRLLSHPKHSKDFYLTPLNIFKVFAVACRVSTKVLELRVLNNRHFATACRVTLQSLNDLECRFLNDLSFGVNIGLHELRDYCLRFYEREARNFTTGFLGGKTGVSHLSSPLRAMSSGPVTPASASPEVSEANAPSEEQQEHQHQHQQHQHKQE